MFGVRMTGISRKKPCVGNPGTPAWKNLRLCVFDKEHGVDRNVDRRDVYVELLVGSRVKRIQTVLGRTENAPQVAAGRFVEDLIAVLNERGGSATSGSRNPVFR